jgi:hypothetical protein
LFPKASVSKITIAVGLSSRCPTDGVLVRGACLSQNTSCAVTKKKDGLLNLEIEGDDCPEHLDIEIAADLGEHLAFTDVISINEVRIQRLS